MALMSENLAAHWVKLLSQRLYRGTPWALSDIVASQGGWNVACFQTPSPLVAVGLAELVGTVWCRAIWDTQVYSCQEK